MKFEIIKNTQFGFAQVTPTPSVDELSAFYNANYYDEKGYAPKYSDLELVHKEITAHEITYLLKGKKGKILDIGCGEGFVINALAKDGWEVTGLDFSHDGVVRHFPHLKERVIKGDIYASLERLMNEQTKFDVIICNNVLEHVTDPLGFLKKFKSLCHKDTVIRIQVPNDFSWYQGLLKKEQLINREYWVAPPGHLSYFNKENFPEVLNANGYLVSETYGDFPIELFLLNEKSNYTKNPEVGPYAHFARLTLEVNLFRSSIEDFLAFRRGCGAAGICRNLIAYCKLK